MRTKIFLAPAAALSLALALPLLAPVRAEATAGASATWRVDGVHSSVVFRTLHMGVANFYGTFDEISGELVYDPKKPEASSIQVTIPTASVHSHNAKRDGHLKSPDFFSAAEFPEITFVSKSVKEAKDDALEVTGVLTLRGVEQEVAARVVKTGEMDSAQAVLVGFEATFEIDMRDFEIRQGGVGPEVHVTIAIEARQG